MSQLTRRHMIAATAAGLAAVHSQSGFGRVSSAAPRSFTLDLNWRSVGVQADQRQAVDYAAKYGFESVGADAGFLSTLDDAGREDLAAQMQQAGVVWGAAGLPVDFRRDEASFEQGLKKLPATALALQQAGVTRVGTWLSPFHDELTYLANFRQHTRRLRACVKILGDHGLRFGMEYVGPKTLWASQRHSFIHTMRETKELIAEIAQPQVGLVLDSWHWYTAHETADDLKSLTNEDIVACDLNDAPAGRPVDEQIDNQRELPSATGVIDLATFLGALVEIGYDGPVRAEPFNARLNEMENDDACRATAAALRKSFGLVGG